MYATLPREESQPIQDDGPRLLGAVLAITLFALATMVARLYVRIRLIRNVGWDDYCMTFAMILSIVGACIVIPEVHYGAGRHKENISNEDFSYAYKLNFVTQPIYLIEICVVKISVGFFLLRIATVPFYRKAIQAIMGFMAFYTLGCFLTIMLQCTNLAVQWDPTVKGTCWSAHTIQALGYTNIACNITTDLLFAIVIPVPMLWHVQMNRRQKVTIIAILGLGIFATAAAVVKVTFLPNYGKTGDWLWDSRNITMWTILESCAGIIGGNLPCLKPLARGALGSTYGRGSRSKTIGTGATPRYPYLSRTSNTLAAKSQGFNSLSSSKAGNHSHDPYDAFMMTSVGPGKEGGRVASAASLRDDGRSDKGSEESIELLDTQGASMKLGGILKTTEVMQTTIEERMVSSSPSSRSGAREDLRPKRDVRDMV